jgi:hypothetical protein
VQAKLCQYNISKVTGTRDLSVPRKRYVGPRDPDGPSEVDFRTGLDLEY